MWGKCFVLIFRMCLGVSGFRLFKNRLSSLSVAESCGGNLKETLSISGSLKIMSSCVVYLFVFRTQIALWKMADHFLSQKVLLSGWLVVFFFFCI